MTHASGVRGSAREAVIVGAGLGGMSAALHLQRHGVNVTLIERLHRVGGLCGTYFHDGHEFTLACNDFGLAMARTMKGLGVPVRFRRYRTRVHYHDRQLHLPPRIPDMVWLAGHWRGLKSYFSALKLSRDPGPTALSNVEALVDASVRPDFLRDLLKLPAYLMGVAPGQLPTEALHAEMDFGYGYWQPVAPDGGPRALADSMADTIRQRGGRIVLGTEFLAVTNGTHCKTVHTSVGDFRCNHLVATFQKPGHYPSGLPRGIPVSVIGLVLDRRFRLPRGIHTHVHYPEAVSEWSRQLDRGEQPATFGFHLFRSNLPVRDGCYTANISFYLPRDCDNPDTAHRQQVERYIFDRLECMLPGIGNAIHRYHFVSPARFRDLHGLAGRVMPVITPPGFRKPDNYCPHTDIHFAGAAAYPPGNHAGAAVLSGAMVADRIRDRIRASESRRM